MKTRFRAIVERSDDDNTLLAIYVPSLQYRLRFSRHPEELELFNRMGQQYYLENKIDSIIKEKKSKQENIEDSSTMALMTQGFSELGGPTHSYDIYFVKNLKDIKPNDIDGVAIVIVGEDSEREAFIISNNSFHSVKKKRWSLDFTLTDDQLSALETTTLNADEPARVTLQNCLVLNQLKKFIAEKAGWIYLGPNSYPLDIFIFDHTRRPCSFFATVLPPFTRFTMVATVSLDTILNLGLLDAMENPFFPSGTMTVTNSTTGNSTTFMVPNPIARPFNISQVACNLAMSLLFTFAGPRQRSVRGLGLQMDDLFIGLYNYFFGPKAPSSQRKKSCKNKCSWLSTKVFIAKAFFNLLVLDQIMLMVLMSYLRLNTISDKIAGTEDSIFSAEFIKDVSFIQWILGQLQDPMMIISESAMISYIIENYFRPTNILESINEIVTEEKKASNTEIKRETSSSRTPPAIIKVGMFRPYFPNDDERMEQEIEKNVALAKSDYSITFDEKDLLPRSRSSESIALLNIGQFRQNTSSAPLLDENKQEQPKRQKGPSFCVIL